MATIFGLAQLNPSDYQYIRQVGRELLVEATQGYIRQVEASFNQASRIFVSGQTSNYSFRNYLPATGYMPEVAEGAENTPYAVTGSWDVGLPLRNFEDALDVTDIDLAYMNPQEYQRHIDGIVTRYLNTRRREILRAVFSDSSYTFSDKRWGNITVQPMANGDATLYPPAVGSDVLRTMDAYVATGYTSANISDTNNPFVTARTYYEDTFGYVQGGLPIYCFINKAQRAKVEALTSFVPVQVSGVSRVTDQEYRDAFEGIPDPAGEVIGSVGNTVISIWNYIPADYMVSMYMGAEAPLMERVDPAETGLNSGLTMLVEPTHEKYIFNAWRARYGFGVANRMNGYVQYFHADTYSTPAIYAR